MKRFKQFFSSVPGKMATYGAGGCLIFIVVITVVSVVGRYVFKIDAVPGAYNMIENIFFPLLVFFALPLSHKEGIFPKLDLSFDKASPKIRCFLKTIIGFFEIAVYLVVFWFLIKFTVSGFISERSVQVGTGYFPVWPIAIVSILAFSMMIFQMLEGFLKELKDY